MLVRFNPQSAGFARLVDSSNSTLDTGIDKLGGGVTFYPVGTFAAGSFTQIEDAFVTLAHSRIEGSSRLIVAWKASQRRIKSAHRCMSRVISKDSAAPSLHEQVLIDGLRRQIVA